MQRPVSGDRRGKPFLDFSDGKLIGSASRGGCVSYLRFRNALRVVGSMVEVVCLNNVRIICMEFSVEYTVQYRSTDHYENWYVYLFFCE